MAFQAHTIINDDLIKTASTISDSAVTYRGYLQFIQWLHEYRTTTIGLPRQTGKTTALLNLMDSNTYLLVHNENMRRYATTQLLTDPPNELRNRILTVTGFVYSVMHGRITQPISKLFTDELFYRSSYNSHDVKLALYPALEELHRHRLLTAEFFMLNVGTPC